MHIHSRFCYFSYDHFCNNLRVMFPELENRGGWVKPELVILFIDSDSEIIRIRDRILIFMNSNQSNPTRTHCK